MSQTYVYSTSLTVTSCGFCHIPFAIPKNLYVARYADGKTFYCPNGHCIFWSETTNDLLKEENAKLAKTLERTKLELTWQTDMRQAATKDADHQRRRAAAARGNLTKIKNRITNGVCPVPGCKRSGLGTDVVAHIRSVHPDYHSHEEG